MTQPKLKLARLRDNKPVKLGVSLDPDLMSDLGAYAKIYEAAYGEPQTVAALINAALFDHGDGADLVWSRPKKAQ